MIPGGFVSAGDTQTTRVKDPDSNRWVKVTAQKVQREGQPPAVHLEYFDEATGDNLGGRTGGSDVEVKSFDQGDFFKLNQYNLLGVHIIKSDARGYGNTALKTPTYAKNSLFSIPSPDQTFYDPTFISPIRENVAGALTRQHTNDYANLPMSGKFTGTPDTRAQAEAARTNRIRSEQTNYVNSLSDEDVIALSQRLKTGLDPSVATSATASARRSGMAGEFNIADTDALTRYGFIEPPVPALPSSADVSQQIQQVAQEALANTPKRITPTPAYSLPFAYNQPSRKLTGVPTVAQPPYATPPEQAPAPTRNFSSSGRGYLTGARGGYFG